MQVGADITKKASKSDVDLGFGCLYKLDKTTTVKGKARGLAPAGAHSHSARPAARAAA